jgi:hypothetical protein
VSTRKLHKSNFLMVSCMPRIPPTSMRRISLLKSQLSLRDELSRQTSSSLFRYPLNNLWKYYLSIIHGEIIISIGKFPEASVRSTELVMHVLIFKKWRWVYNQQNKKIRIQLVCISLLLYYLRSIKRWEW